jgi:mevalonate kinase
MNNWDLSYKSCGKLVLAGEYNLLNGGLGISLALNRFATLFYKNDNSSLYEAEFLDKKITDYKLIEPYQLKGLFFSKIEWNSFNGWGSSGACRSNIAKHLNLDIFNLKYQGSGIDLFTSYLNSSLLYRKNNPVEFKINENIKKHLELFRSKKSTS